MLTTITLLLLPQHYSSASNNKYNKMLPRKAGGHTTNKKEFVVDYGASDGKLSIPKHTIVGNFGFLGLFYFIQT